MSISRFQFFELLTGCNPARAGRHAILLAVLVIIVAYCLFLFISSFKTCSSETLLGSFDLPCLGEGYKIILFEGNEDFEPYQSLYFSITKNGITVVSQTHFAAIDVSLKDASRFIVPCNDSMIHVILDKTDTMEQIPLNTINPI